MMSTSKLLRNSAKSLWIKKSNTFFPLFGSSLSEVPFFRSDAQDKVYCRQLVDVARTKSDNFSFGRKLEILYDGSSYLYSPFDFEDQEVLIEMEDFPEELRDVFGRSVTVFINRTATNHILPLSTAVDKMPIDQFSEFRRFLSLAMCQDALNRSTLSEICEL